MSSAEPFPLYFPSDARRPFESDEVIRRYARVANLGSSSRILDLASGRGPVALLLAKELGCQVIAADSDEKALQALGERAKAAGLADRISLRKVDFAKLTFPDADFDGIFIHGRTVFPVGQAVKALRRNLAPRGRLVLTYPTKVGRFPNRTAVDFWERRLNEQLLIPRELLMVFEKAGFEPEGVETLSDPELSELYRQLEPKLAVQDIQTKPLRDEIELFRQQSGKSSVTYAVVVGRRKEPGEKPPASRDRG